VRSPMMAGQRITLLTLIIIIGAFLALAVVTLLLDTSPRWLAAAYGAAAILAALLRQGLSEGLSYGLEHSGLITIAVELERTLRDKPTQGVLIVAQGHDHQPAIDRLDDTWYVKTGAWAPTYDKEGPVEGREALTFLRLTHDHDGAPELLR